MSTRHQLENYLDQARQRLKWVMASQSVAVLIGALLLLTLLAAVALGKFAFADSAVLIARSLLAAAVVGTGIWFWLRLRTLRRDGGAAQLERALPAQSGRVTTYLQESTKEAGSASVLLDLLAEDAQRVADQEALTQSIPARRLLVPGLIAGACAAALVASFLGKGLLGEATKRVWLGKETEIAVIAKAAGGIKVLPGDATVRRNQDLGVTALVANGGGDVTVYVKFGGESEWESAPMTADGKGGYAFTLFAVRDDAQYYVSSGSLRSKEHHIQVVDLPKVQHLRLTYDYPDWTGLPRRLEESGGDIHAVSGTRVALEVVTDKPLETPLLVIDGSDSSLSQAGSTSRGNIAVKKVGHYRIATRFGNEIVPLTPDYAIDLVEDQRPTIQIGKPGKDYQATNIEEVPVNIRARDDFRLDALELQYSVNGGDWQHENLPAGSADIQAAALLRLEELQQRGVVGEAPLLTPGDLVSYYAVARDHGGSTQTDLFLIQIAPFERRFTQSQANGGGGGGGGGGEEQQGQISQRQKEVLLATFNLQKNKDGTGAREAERDADNARMLAQVQDTLAEQANTLVERAKARQLEREDATVASFIKGLQDAAKEMVPAAKKLTDQDLQAAIQHEQKALQHLLRAESTFRDIQVALQQQQRGGGGGGGGQAGRDVAEMTELELDLEKNQYETEPQMSSQQQAQVEDELVRRLRELARRQEQLAREAERKSIPLEQQKWQQEQLQREAEQLRQQLEQLAQQNSQQGQQGQQGQQQGQQSRQQQAQQQGQRGQQGQQQGQQGQRGQQGQQQGQQSQQGAAASQAAQQVAQAMEQMRQAQQRGDREAAARASEQLNRAREQLENGRQQGNSAQQLANLAQEASELVAQQREAAQDLRAALGNRRAESGLSATEADRLAEQMRQLQRELGQLQGNMDDARRQSRQDSPRASQKLAQATQELQDSGAPSSLSRIASDIRNGRGAEAQTRSELIIGGALQRLEQQLAEARDLAGGEARSRQQARQPNEADLLTELGDARRALERARQDAAARSAQNQRGQQQGQGQSQNRNVAQNQSGERGERNGSEQGGQSPNAQEGQSGQGGGQQGQDGQGGQGQRGQNGGNQQAGAAGQGGANGRQGGGLGNGGRFGSGDDGFGGVGGVGDVRPLTDADRAALRQQGMLSGQRLQALRDQLQQGALSEADATALLELSERLRRNGADPKAADGERMLALVNQLELSALQSQQAKGGNRTTRSADPVDDSRRYRDNVAEYYRKLGEANDGK